MRAQESLDPFASRELVLIPIHSGRQYQCRYDVSFIPSNHLPLSGIDMTVASLQRPVDGLLSLLIVHFVHLRGDAGILRTSFDDSNTLDLPLDRLEESLSHLGAVMAAVSRPSRFAAYCVCAHLDLALQAFGSLH